MLTAQVRGQIAVAGSALLVIALCALMTGCARALDREQMPLSIVLASGKHHEFRVEMADSKYKRRRGLMFRDSLEPGSGMLFDFEDNSPVAMWMVNTYIPLDMLFISEEGSIVKIAEHTRPRSRTLIESGVPVRAVLELNAGVAAALGIRPGDRVLHPIFGDAEVQRGALLQSTQGGRETPE